MAATTVTRTYSAISDVKASLNQNSLSRLLSIGTDWTKIRIATRLMVNGNTAFANTPSFAMGLCSGTSLPWNNGGGITTHFLGCVTAKADWSLASDHFFINSGSTDFRVATRVGTTTNFGSQPPASLVLPALAAGNRVLLFMDITKGSPNFTINVFYKNVTNTTDISSTVFRETAIVEACTLSDYVFGTARTIAVDEGANGSLNAVNFGWDRTVPIELSDVGIVRLA